MANPYTTLTTAVDNYLSNIEQELQSNQPASDRRIEEITQSLERHLGDYFSLAVDANMVTIETCSALIASISQIERETNDKYRLNEMPRELSHALDLLTEVAARSCRFTLVPRVRAFVEVYRNYVTKRLDKIEFHDDQTDSPYAEYNRQYRG
jgi:hypothetical protein